MKESDQKIAYLKVIYQCNLLIDKVGRSLWAKLDPAAESQNDCNVNLEFPVVPGDGTPRRVMLCLAKQLHNFKCVAKILEKVREAQKYLSIIEDDVEAVNPFDVNLDLMRQLNSRVTIMAKCETAMQRRHSVRHRLLPVNRNPAAAAGVACFALCDLQCSVLDLQLSQSEKLTLIDNSNSQSWLVENSDGSRIQVPPLFIAVIADSAELLRVRRVKAALITCVRNIHSKLAHQLLQATRRLETMKQELIVLLESDDEANTMIYKLKILDKYLRSLKSLDNTGFIDLDFCILHCTIEYVQNKLNQVAKSDALSQSPLAKDFIKLQSGLDSVRKIGNLQAESQISRTARQQQACIGSSVHSLLSGRSHSLSCAARRNSIFEFELELTQSTQQQTSIRRCQSNSELSIGSSSSSSALSRAGHSELITRQRQQIQRKYVIRSVWDGESHVTLEEAAERGLVNFSRGTYRDPSRAGREVPMQVAMAAGRIVVEFTSTKKLSEDSSSFGLIQVEESTPEVESVRDRSSGRSLTTDEAEAAGLLDRTQQLVRAKPGSGQWLSAVEAQKQGLASIGHRHQLVSYVVHSVVDVKERRKLPFQEAVQLGIVDRDTACFTNTETGEVIDATEAIHHGFLKAYKVDNAKSLDIDPQNRISIANFNKLKNRWHAVNAFTKGLKLRRDRQSVSDENK